MGCASQELGGLVPQVDDPVGDAQERSRACGDDLQERVQTASSSRTARGESAGSGRALTSSLISPPPRARASHARRTSALFPPSGLPCATWLTANRHGVRL